MKFSAGLLLLSIVTVCLGEYLEGPEWRNVPFFFRKQFQRWSTNDSCNYERIKLLPTDVSLNRMDKEPVYLVSTKIAMDEYVVKKVELHLEIYETRRRKAEKLQNRTFVANILTSGNRIGNFSLISSPIILNGNSLELIFDISSMYNAVKEKFLVDMNFKVRTQRKNGRTAKLLMRKNAKAYVYVYESIESCEFLHFLHREKRFRRSSSFYRNMPNNNFNFSHNLAESDVCKVKEFPINFTDIGFNWILFPVTQDIGICSGSCSIQSAQSGYKMIQTASYSITRRGQPIACYPIEYGGINVIYSDFSDQMLVIAKFIDIRVTRCACQ